MAKNIFNTIMLKKPKRNSFDLTHDVKLSLQMGNLTPICLLETVPGDKFNISCESLLRFAPLVSPVMHRMDVTMHYFFVPNRILWEGWEEYITNGTGTGDIPVPPFVMYDSGSINSKLGNYLGLPAGAAPYKVNALPFAAYQAIYNEYYRDQNLVPEVSYGLGDGDNTLGFGELGVLRKRAWEHDYFTSCLPSAQKGAAVNLPLGTFQDIPVMQNNTGSPTDTQYDWASVGDITGAAVTNVGAGDPDNPDVDPNFLYADTSDLLAQTTTVEDLRRAFRLQEWLEKNARAGSRYVESILAHFGVKSSDARLQRPEYITGSKSPVVISEILNTSGTFSSGDPTDPTSPPQGNMAGHGISVTSGKQGSYYCEEHGFIVGIMSVMPKTAYQQGIPKMFTKTDDRFLYFWPEFANIGEQAVLNKELFVDAVAPNNTFGYVPRYAEYKFMPSRVCADFQTSLSYWHLGRIFATEPALNQEFIECDPDLRIFAVTDGIDDSLYCHVLNKIQAIRPMPKFGTPSF